MPDYYPALKEAKRVIADSEHAILRHMRRDAIQCARNGDKFHMSRDEYELLASQSPWAVSNTALSALTDKMYYCGAEVEVA